MMKRQAKLQRPSGRQWFWTLVMPGGESQDRWLGRVRESEREGRSERDGERGREREKG